METDSEESDETGGFMEGYRREYRDHHTIHPDHQQPGPSRQRAEPVTEPNGDKCSQNYREEQMDTSPPPEKLSLQQTNPTHRDSTIESIGRIKSSQDAEVKGKSQGLQKDHSSYKSDRGEQHIKPNESNSNEVPVVHRNVTAATNFVSTLSSGPQISELSSIHNAQKMALKQQQDSQDPDFPDFEIVPVQRDDSGVGAGSVLPLMARDDSGINSGSGTVLIIQNLNISQHNNVTNNQPGAKENIELFETTHFPEVLLEALKPLDLDGWKLLASYLQLDSYIESIETEVKNHSKCPTRLLLDKWWQVQGRKADISGIKSALQRMHRQDVLDDLEEAEAKWAELKQEVTVEDASD